MTDWSPTDLAYFAGILDGEGCLSLDHLKVRVAGGGRRLYHNPTIRVANTDARLIHWLQSRFPGTVTPIKIRANMRKPQWMWALYGPSVETALVAALPYLLIKREQAELLIEFRRTMQPKGRQPGYGQNGRSLSEQTLARRDAMAGQLRILNKRGVAS